MLTEKLVQLIDGEKITKAFVVKAAGISRPALDSILAGKDFKVSNLEKLATALGVPVGYFFDESKLSESEESSSYAKCTQTINDRIQELVDDLCDGNKAAFAKSIGLGATALSNYLGHERRSRPNIDMISRIISTYDVDPRWLLLGSKKQEATKAASSNLSSQIKYLQSLLAEKERLINVLMDRK